MDEKKLLGEIIRAARQENKFTLKQLEEKAGVSFSHISKIERGEFSPTKETLEALGRSLELDIETLFILAGYPTDSLREMALERVNQPDLVVDLEDGTKFIIETKYSSKIPIESLKTSSGIELISHYLGEKLERVRDEQEEILRQTQEMDRKARRLNDDYNELTSKLRKYQKWNDFIKMMEHKGISPKDALDNVIHVDELEEEIESLEEQIEEYGDWFKIIDEIKKEGYSPFEVGYLIGIGKASLETFNISLKDKINETKS